MSGDRRSVTTPSCGQGLLEAEPPRFPVTAPARPGCRDSESESDDSSESAVDLTYRDILKVRQHALTRTHARTNAISAR